MLPNIFDFFLHLDRYLSLVLQAYGSWIYLLIFVVIFLETGLVITPFFPGDSLLFVSGALAASNLLNIFLLFFLVSIAAILGDTVNYWIGYYLGIKALGKFSFFKQNHYDRTYKFYKKHGGKTIIFARFVPVIRTFAPFVAGVGRMKYHKFLGYNVVGGVLWAALFLFAGFYFGNIAFVKNNLSYFIILIILLSILPAIIEFIKQKSKSK